MTVEKAMAFFREHPELIPNQISASLLQSVSARMTMFYQLFWETFYTSEVENVADKFQRHMEGGGRSLPGAGPSEGKTLFRQKDLQLCFFYFNVNSAKWNR